MRPAHLPIDDRLEALIIEAGGGHGRLLALHQPRDATGTTITVHGINAGPESLAPLHRRAVSSRRQLFTFLYDDQTTSLCDSARELSYELLAQRHLFVGDTSIEAYSMGARITLAAFWYLDHRMTQLGRVNLTLIAPELAGHMRADLATFTPEFLSGLIPGVAPGNDMGQRSSMQTILENDIRMEPNVRTFIFVGDADHVLNQNDARFTRVAQRLRARVIRVRGEHVSVLARVTTMPHDAHPYVDKQ